MKDSVSYRDGIHIELCSGDKVILDGYSSEGDINVLSHAHGDHLFSGNPSNVICSDLTANLAEARKDIKVCKRVNDDRIELINAGHIAGSRSAIIQDNSTTYLYTGDICTRDRFYLKGFKPVEADILIIESTYGKPNYVFPDQEQLENSILNWLNRTYDQPVLLFGYSLGRAQKLQVLVNKSDRDNLFVTESISRINDVIESHYNMEFGARKYSSEHILGPGDALVLPMQTSKLDFVNKIVQKTNAIKAGFSGWAVDQSFKYRGGYDVTYPLSDHCDFNELIDVIKKVEPKKVYTHHGFANELNSYITSELGVNAQTLKKNQSSLGDF